MYPITNNQINVMALGLSSIINLGDNTKDSQKSLFSEQEWDSIKKYYSTRYKKIEYIMPEEACAEAWDTIIAIVRENNLFLGSEYISSLKASETDSVYKGQERSLRKLMVRAY
ncbi:hypothetical protein HPULCUR_002261 [Helicostylum pulchrum]|uniref:Uncharacterized protein n=1 Tax=Helicostylum pulchrum TaxID=562976 RepID=A0ABP9XRT3_9FUNG